MGVSYLLVDDEGHDDEDKLKKMLMVVSEEVQKFVWWYSRAIQNRRYLVQIE